MDESARSIFEDLGISLLLGLLVGLQRQHSASLMAGLRTFPLITVLGTLAGAFDAHLKSGGWLVPCGFLGLVAIVAVGKYQESHLRDQHVDWGITTEVAILVMYVVGAFLTVGDRYIAIAVGVTVAVLLQFKTELHGLAARLGNEDLRAIMTFALITGIILPVLPNRTYDLISPWNVLNPFEIWTMVVLMVGISLGGFLTYKLFGRNAGILLGGLLGGAISSTATTVSYAQRSREGPQASALGALVIVIASTVTFLRVILEISIVAWRHVGQLVPPIALLMVVSILTALASWRRLPKSGDIMPTQKNPAELRSALVFAALYAGVLMGLAVAKSYLGGAGLYLVAVLSGLTDMDAITLSTARLVGLDPAQGGIEPQVAWRVILLAVVANLLFKWALCAIMGTRGLTWRVGVAFSVPILVGCVLFVLWPDS